MDGDTAVSTVTGIAPVGIGLFVAAINRFADEDDVGPLLDLLSEDSVIAVVAIGPDGFDMTALFSNATTDLPIPQNVFGTPGDDTLTGGTGADSLNGRGGKDVLIASGDDPDLFGGEGNDRLQVLVSDNFDLFRADLFGEAGNDTLIAADDGFENRLDGGTGDDLMIGSNGQTIFYVDSEGDRIVERREWTRGNDEVVSKINYKLPFLIERLVLHGEAEVGIGNARSNTIWSQAKGDVRLMGLEGNDTRLSGFGNDTLIGGAGRDQMNGGTGEDLYVMIDVGDSVRDFGGHDEVRSTVNVTADAVKDVEIVRLLGGADLDIFLSDASGTYLGNAGDNCFDAVLRNDAVLNMAGAGGDNTYVLRSQRIAVIERSGNGTDTILCFGVNVALSGHVENVVPQDGDGPANWNTRAIGNGLDNQLAGNGRNNLLNGKGGDDTLTGGAGADTFVLNLRDPDVDTITDFASGEDRIVLGGAGALAFGTVAREADDRILFDTATGTLCYDADGVGGADAVVVAELTGVTSITAEDLGLL